MQPPEKKQRSQWMQTVISMSHWVAILVCLFCLYGVNGNAQDVKFLGTSAILWMVDRWSGSGGDLSHGWIIPIVSGFVIWKKRKDFLDSKTGVCYPALVFVAICLVMHWFGVRAQLTRISLLSLIGLLWSVPFTLYGPRIAQLLFFPCTYLVFCIPLSFLNNITVPLRIMASTLSCHIMNGLGIPAIRVGTAIRSTAAGGFNFDVADPCSGLRSLIAMTALMAIYAYLTQKSLLKKWILFLCAIPVAIAGNVFRILSIAVVAEGFGAEKAMVLYHDFSGFLVFSMSIFLMVSIGEMLRMNYREKFRTWMDQEKERT
ncbi:MAG: exosortase/archaeosortase family protein [Kiritimatiellia bacterium]|jgi:exosortase|nr:exosortase/archaeosortase family protein [Kiritimatiellia bacterium]MDP6847892.1 exosortase/archaeosortase family protein [Kiritimatiellia bacterium]